jgi:hypothetical protein
MTRLGLLSAAIGQRLGDRLKLLIARSKPLNQRAAALDSPALMERNSSRRSRAARFVSSTWYAVLTADFVEDLAGWSGPASGNIFETLADTLGRIRLGSDVEQTLVGNSVLDNQFRLAVNGEEHRSTRGLEALHRFGRLTPKVSQGPNVLSNVNHSLRIAPLRVLRLCQGVCPRAL